MRLPVSLLAASLWFTAAGWSEQPSSRAASPAPIQLRDGGRFPSRDSLDCEPDSVADAAKCLDGLKWQGGSFEVKLTPAKPAFGDWLVRYPSPLPSGDTTNDLVAME